MAIDESERVRQVNSRSPKPGTTLRNAARGMWSLDQTPLREQALEGVRAFAEAIGTQADEAVENATAFRWLGRAMPT